MAAIIGSIVRQNESECELSLADMRRLTGCRDSNPRRCRIGTAGVSELVSEGLLKRTGNSDEYQVIMPDQACTSEVQRTSEVRGRTSEVQKRTSEVRICTSEVRAYKEEEREREEEKTQSACAREAADRCFAAFPPNRRTNSSNFVRLFSAAVQAWAVRYGVPESEAVGQVEARTLAHIEAHRRGGSDARFFPAVRKFFDETIDNEPDTRLDPAADREAHAQRLLKILEARP